MTQENIAKIAKQMWDSAQRIGMEIAEKPLEQREWAFGVAEECLRDAARVKKMSEETMEEFIKLQMQALRSAVLNIDVGGNPQGGKA